MKQPSFFHGVIVAAIFAFFASAMIATLTPFVGFFSVIRFVIPALIDEPLADLRTAYEGGLERALSG